MVQIKIFPVIAIQLTPLQNQAVQVDPRLKKHDEPCNINRIVEPTSAELL
jgi:hypothetical protein